MCIRDRSGCDKDDRVDKDGKDDRVDEEEAVDILEIKEQFMRILNGEEPEPGFDDSIFAMNRGRGKELYRAFTDEELLDYLHDLAERLDVYKRQQFDLNT